MENDKVDQLHELHSRATGKPSQAGKAESLDRHDLAQVHDSIMSWGGGQPVASQGRNDTTKFPDSSSGVSAETRKATEPAVLDTFGVTPAGGRLGLHGVDQIAGSTPLSNPDAVRSRR